jgi:serine/threonine protein kinase
MIQKLGKYSIIEKMGEGSMGAVYKAYHDVLDRYVAIKTMAEDIKWEPELKLRFYREARSAAGLRHPNIVTIHDLGEEGKITYIVMELLEGKDLKAMIRDKDPLPLESKLSIMIQVADGLNHAHMHGIIHRDIKPGNIHINPDGNVKILDFGIARIPSSDLTRSGVRLGTPVYMSPEQIRGGDYDERSDIFSAGIVFYELLTYQHPFRDKNLVKTMDNILFLTNLPFQEQFPNAPPGLFQILSRLLEKEPNRRYASMADVGRACRQLQEQLISAVHRMTEELQLCIPRLREACEQPGAAPHLRELLRQATVLLGQQQSLDYLSIHSLMTALSRESILPLPSAAAGPLPMAREAKETSLADRPAETMRVTSEPVAVPEGVAPGSQVGRAGTAGPISKDRPAYPAEQDQARGREMLQKGEAFLKDDRPEEALEFLRQAMGLLGPKTELVQLLSQARSRIEEKKKLRVQECFQTAQEAIASERFSEAIEALDDILQLESDLPEAVELRRQALADLEAQKAAQAAREEGEREKTSGFRLLAEKKFRDSIRALRRASELLGEDEAIKLGIAEAEKGIQLEELRVRTQAELTEAWQAFRSDALDKARLRANRVLELSPRHPEALDLLNKINQAQEEKRRKERIAELYGKVQEAFNEKALDEAAACATEALTLEPGDARFEGFMQQILQAKEQIRREEEVSLLLTKCREALDAGKFEDATAFAESALSVIPGHSKAAQISREIQTVKGEKQRQEELAAIVSEAQQAYLRGDLSQCELHAKRLQQRDPQNRKAKELLQLVEQSRQKERREKVAQGVAQGHSALSLGDLESAGKYAADALNLEPSSEEAKALLSEIEQARRKALMEKVAQIVARGRLAIETENLSEASKAAQDALALDGRFAECGEICPGNPGSGRSEC